MEALRKAWKVLGKTCRLLRLPPHELLDTRTEYCFVVVSARARSGYLRSWKGGRSILIKGRSTRDSYTFLEFSRGYSLEKKSSGYKTLRFASVLSELSISVVPDNRGIVRGFPVVV